MNWYDLGAPPQLDRSGLQVLVAWTRTGEVIDHLDIRDDWSYDESISWGDLGKATVSVPLLGHGDRLQRPLLKAIAKEMSSMTLCLARNGRALWAGPVWTFGWDAGAVRLGCASIGKLLDSRMLVKNPLWGNPIQTAANLHFTLGTRDLVLQLLTEGTTGARRDLPLVIGPQSGMAGTAVDYVAADLRTVFEAVKDVVDRDDGPDVLLRPDLYNDGDSLRWLAEVGAPDLGSAGRWRRDRDPLPTWDSEVSIDDISGDRDASEMVSTAYVVGGQGAANIRMIGVNVRDRGDPLPALERADRTTVSETRQQQLNALAASYGAVHAYPTESWSIVVKPDHQPIIGEEWSFGDAIGIRVSNHPWLDDGRYLRRVVGVTHSAKKLTLKTTDGAEVGQPRYVS